MKSHFFLSPFATRMAEAKPHVCDTAAAPARPANNEPFRFTEKQLRRAWKAAGYYDLAFDLRPTQIVQLENLVSRLRHGPLAELGEPYTDAMHRIFKRHLAPVSDALLRGTPAWDLYVEERLKFDRQRCLAKLRKPQPTATSELLNYACYTFGFVPLLVALVWLVGRLVFLVVLSPM